MNDRALTLCKGRSLKVHRNSEVGCEEMTMNVEHGHLHSEEVAFSICITLLGI